MARRKRGTPPAYLLHRASGQAYSTYRGRSEYFGPHGTPESRRRYQDFLRRWEAAERAAEPAPPAPPGCTVEMLAGRWFHHAERRYRRDDGTATPEVRTARGVLRALVAAFGECRADDFRARELRALRQTWVDAGLCRRTCNRYAGIVRRCWRWAVEHDLVAPETLVSLASVRDLDRREAPDYPPVAPVEWARVEAALPHLTRHVRALVLVQWWVGCRPGEACRMRRSEIDQSGRAAANGRTVRLEGVWTFSPTQHKTRHKGRHLCYLLGPRARELLTPWVDAATRPDDYLFRPAEAMAEYYARLSRRAAPSGRVGRAGPCYSVEAYNHAVADACRKAGVERFSVNALRHAALTRFDEAVGLELASRIAGHASADTTSIYVAGDLRRAAEAVERLS